MKKLHLIIVAHPGSWQLVLQKNIETHSFIKVVGTVSGSLSAIQLASQCQPDIVLIDSSIPVDEVVVLIQKLKAENPEVASIAIADTSQQRLRMAQSGADYTVSSVHYETQLREIFSQQEQRLSGGKPGSARSTKPGHRAD